MAGLFQIGIKAAKAGFFDRQRVVNAMDKVTHQVLSRFGAYVRQRARTSIRKRRGASTPGTPPHSHGMHLLRTWILFSYDRSAKTVVIGPALLARGTGAPKVTEYGGTNTILSRGKGGWDKGGNWAAGKLQRVRARYPARPFMRPAFAAELAKLPAAWRDRLR